MGRKKEEGRRKEEAILAMIAVPTPCKVMMSISMQPSQGIMERCPELEMHHHVFVLPDTALQHGRIQLLET